jgi:hypothetical protein
LKILLLFFEKLLKMPPQQKKSKKPTGDKFFVNRASKKELTLFSSALLDHCEVNEL